MAGATLQADEPDYRRGSIHMAVTGHGYVGLVRTEDDALNVAAALDARFIRRSGGIAQAIASTIASSGLPDIAAAQTSWRGTPPLTRTASRVAGERLFAIGDAAGYVEPFTGEGMAWAMTSAILVLPYVRQALKSWQESLAIDWNRCHQHATRGHQRDCRRLAEALRRPWLVWPALAALRHCPQLARPLIRRFGALPEEMYP